MKSKSKIFKGIKVCPRILQGVVARCSNGRDEAHFSPSAKLRRPPSYIPIGLWMNCSIGRRSVNLVEPSFTDPRGGLNGSSKWSHSNNITNHENAWVSTALPRCALLVSIFPKDIKWRHDVTWHHDVTSHDVIWHNKVNLHRSTHLTIWKWTVFQTASFTKAKATKTDACKKELSFFITQSAVTDINRLLVSRVR